MKAIIDKYFFVQFIIFVHLLLKGKISIKKIYNVFFSYLSYIIKSTKSGKSPFMINFELWNECNEACLFCRTGDGKIYNYDNPELTIAKGKLDIEVYKKIIDQTSPYLVMSVPYINGEPLLSKDIYEAVSYANEKKLVL